MTKLIVPRNLTKLQTKTALRRYFEERFPNEEKLEEKFVNGSCYLTVGVPKLEYSKFHRLQYHTDEYVLRFEIVPGVGEIVMEG